MSMNFRFVNVNDIEVSHSMALTVTGNIQVGFMAFKTQVVTVKNE